jgi:hypothetical protein
VIRSHVLVAALLLGLSRLTSAQQIGARSPVATQPQVDSGAAVRTRLELEIRRRFARMVRMRVGLTDDQVRRLAPVSQRYEQQRRRLQIEERDARQALRGSLRNEQTADPTQVDRHLQKLVEIQKQRAQLLEAEQRDLATIMNPMQRAKYMALQDQIRRQLEQVRQRRAQLLEGDAAGTARPLGRRPAQRPPQ